MAIYTDGKWNVTGKYGVARSSKIKESNHIYDVLDTTNAIEQGSNIKLGDFVEGELQLRTALTPTAKDKIVFVCDVPLIYESDRISDQYEYKFVNKAGKNTKAYELGEDDVFGVSDYMFTTVVDTNVKLYNYVVVDGARKWKELASAPLSTDYGFIGQVIGFEKYQYDTVVLVRVIKNVTEA